MKCVFINITECPADGNTDSGVYPTPVYSTGIVSPDDTILIPESSAITTTASLTSCEVISSTCSDLNSELRSEIEAKMKGNQRESTLYMSLGRGSFIISVRRLRCFIRSGDASYSFPATLIILFSNFFSM